MHDDGMASHPDEYWEIRRELTPSPNPPVVADGDQRLAVLIDLSESRVASRYRRLRDRLSEFRCLKPTPTDELHLTVKLFDHTPTAATRGGSSSVSPTRIADAVTGIVEDCGPFRIDFPRLNLFPDTVYAEVDDGGRLADLNRALCELPWTTTSDRDARQFIPHLTLGYFTGDEGYDRLIDFLEAHRDPELPPMTVAGISIVAYDLTSNWGSAATTLRTYPL
ncbi:2'-5' RNA ligase family protein [Halobellus ruber]|uniref:2'-5' RNA ligase family protein n=1 Tax=Halobellus ruber TaxID=2761102 RepID=A0A7J9SMI9_9EURY|nr:2'-5' RNA ligase family protein [Halobellus ruber]MBB6646281.1 2'-5' RNA ligase family protein [Halobellus ruber]